MCGDDENCRKLKTDKLVLYYGFNDNNDVIAKNIRVNDEITTVDVYIKGRKYVGQI